MKPEKRTKKHQIQELPRLTSRDAFPETVNTGQNRLRLFNPLTHQAR